MTLAPGADAPKIQDSSQPSSQILIWLGLALLFHLLLTLAPWQTWFAPAQKAPPTPVAVEPYSADALKKLKNQWREKSLLIQKDQPASESKPENARYFSDRNIRVDREQRAAQTDILPRPGASTSPTLPQLSRPSTAQPRPIPKLSRLGVPLKTKPETSPAQQPSRESTRGADQNVLDRTLPMGSENLLNSEQSVYYSFYARLYEAIGPLWQSRIRSIRPSRRLAQGDYTAHADVIFNAEGKLVRIDLLASSGVPEFDAAIEYAWRKIGTFPNPPRALLDSENQIHTGWTFTVVVDDQFQLLYPPPSRSF